MRLLFKMILWAIIVVLPGGFLLLPLALRRTDRARAPQLAVAA
jgi:hypothetical protein